MFEENILATEHEALGFVDKYGLVTLFPIRGFSFPNLYQAIAGKDRNEKFDRTWQWADNLAQKKRIYYGKFVCKQVTLISLEVFPYVYRLNKRNDFNDVSRAILEFLGQHGATSTTNLRKQLQLAGRKKKSTFVKSMDELQLGFAISVVDRAKTAQMTYTWDLLERWMPKELLEKAENVDETTAEERIKAKLLDNKVFPKLEDGKLFPVNVVKKKK